MSTVADLCCDSIPPSTLMTSPVIYEASSEARNTAGPAMSSGSPGCPRGIFSPRRRLASSPYPSVSIDPGIKAHTRIP